MSLDPARTEPSSRRPEAPGVIGFAGPHVLVGAPGWPVVGLTVAHAETGVAIIKPTGHAAANLVGTFAFLDPPGVSFCRSEPGAEIRARHGREDLLLVVHRPAAVGGHVGWVVSRDEQRVDVAGGDRQAEAVADESHRAVGVGARQLAQAADSLARLLRGPAY